MVKLKKKYIEFKESQLRGWKTYPLVFWPDPNSQLLKGCFANITDMFLGVGFIFSISRYLTAYSSSMAFTNASSITGNFLCEVLASEIEIQVSSSTTYFFDPPYIL